MIVIDTSVAAKWLLTRNEKGVEKSRHLLHLHQNGEEEILVPDLFYYEIANLFVTKKYLPWRSVHRFLKSLYAFKLNLYHPKEPDLKETSKLASQLGTSVYDMLYAAVAKRHECSLITADEIFIKKTRFPFVKLLKDIEIEEEG